LYDSTFTITGVSRQPPRPGIFVVGNRVAAVAECDKAVVVSKFETVGGSGFFGFSYITEEKAIR